jgi:hypothetical protein
MKKKLKDASLEFSPQQIAKSIEEGKKQRDIKNGRYRKAGQKVGRNDYCPCGSGRKNKHCHNADRISADGKSFATQKANVVGRAMSKKSFAVSEQYKSVE